MNQPIAMNTTRKHVVWLDVVRLVAMFTVVCCHSADPFNFYPGEPPANIDEIKFWGAAYGAFLRPCVPLFVMITGALLLPVRGEISAFYKKRISRVFWPFLIWSVIYNLFPWFTGLLGLNPEIILDFFPYSGEEAARQSLNVSLGYSRNASQFLFIRRTYVVYLSAYRIISIPSYFLRMGRKGLGESQTMVSCRMGNNRLVTLLLSVRIPIHLGRLCVELIQYVLLFCRIQRVLAIGTLSAQPRLVME